MFTFSFGLLAGEKVQTLVPQATGTKIGDMVNNGGLPASFDGVTNQTAAAASASPSQVNAFIGKDWGVSVTKTITGIKIWGSNNAGYFSGTVSRTLTLRGSDTAPTLATDGTSIHVIETANDDNLTHALSVLTGIAANKFRYHWVAITATPSDIAYMAEVEFYEDI